MVETPIRRIAGLLLAGLAYFGLAKFGMAVFSLQPSNITLLWLPFGLALIMCLRWGYQAVPLIVLASFAANFSGMSSGSHPVLHTLIAALSDGLAGVLAMALLQRKLPGGLQRTADLVPFGLWVCLVPTFLTALLLVANLVGGGYIRGDQSLGFLRMLMLGDSLGLLLLYPIYQGWVSRRTMQRHEWHWMLGTILAIVFFLGLGASALPGAVYFVLPALLILSFNSSLFVFSLISALSLIAIVIATAHNLGPFVSADPLDSNFRLIAFAFSTALTILGVGLQNLQMQLTELSRDQWQGAAEHDALTGLGNRRSFMPQLEVEHERALRSGRGYAVAVLDLDNFKSINDTYGHPAGDEVIRVFARVMGENCRLIDRLARMGGEEFAILLPECPVDEATKVMERIRQTQAQTRVQQGEIILYVTVSIGIAAFVGGEEEVTNVLARADKALYAAKKAGRNRVEVDNGPS